VFSLLWVRRMGLGSSPEFAARGLRNVSAFEPRLASLLLPSRCDLGSQCADSDPNVKIWRGSVARFAIVTCRGFGIRLRDSLNLFLNCWLHAANLVSCKVFSCRCDDDEWNLCWNSASCPIGLACVTIDGKFYIPPFVVCWRCQ